MQQALILLERDIIPFTSTSSSRIVLYEKMRSTSPEMVVAVARALSSRAFVATIAMQKERSMKMILLAVALALAVSATLAPTPGQAAANIKSGYCPPGTCPGVCGVKYVRDLSYCKAENCKRMRCWRNAK